MFENLNLSKDLMEQIISGNNRLLAELHKNKYQPTEVDRLLSYWYWERQYERQNKTLIEKLANIPTNTTSNNGVQSVTDGELASSIDTILELFGRAEEGEGE